MNDAIRTNTMIVPRRMTTTQAVRFQQAVELEKVAAVHYEADEYEQAIPLFQECLRSGLDTVTLRSGLGTAYMATGRNREAIREYQISLKREPRQAKTLSNLILLLDHMPETTLESALAARRDWWRIFGSPLRSTWRRHENTPDPERPLRIGYVSGDMRHHSAAIAFSPVVLRHTPDCAAVCYYTCPGEDDVTEIFVAETAEFHRVAALDPEALAAKIRADRIDVLVDLSGHSAQNRLKTFCRRPAPVQVTAFGYATGTGLPVFDAFFADEVTVPQRFAARGYAEPVRYLPCIIPYAPMPETDEPDPLPALARGYVTFGSLNRWLKITPAVLDVWGEVLAAVPRSRMLLKERIFERAEIREQVLRAFAAHGITPDRVEFRGWTNHAEHVRTFHDVDLALDPFPHSGGVTALEGLAHGVPAVTLLGERVPERLSASFSTAVGLHAFVASSRAEYVQMAVGWATEFLPKLAEVRRSLPFRIAESGLVVDYLPAVERHYRELWRAWCRRSTTT